MDRLTRPDLSPPGHPHRQHEPARRGPRRRAARPAGPGPLRLQLATRPPSPPTRRKVLEGLRRDDLFTVVHEQFATDTVDYADIVLPATTQLEHVDIHGSYGHHYVMLNPPAIAPRGECRSNNDVFRALAAPARLRARAVPRRRDPDPRGARRRPDPRGDHARAASRRRARSGSNLPETYAPFADGVFPTPSGKCELYSERMKADGLDPLPTYTPPREDPQTRPDLAARYPLQLLSPPRPQFLNSTFANSPTPPHGRRRPDGRARRPRTPRRAAWPTASGPRSTTTAAGSRPGSP